MSQNIQVTCPHCGQVYSMTPQQSGQTVQCTKCSQPFTATPGQGALPYSQSNPGPAEGNTSNPMATASLVCGLLLCIPFVSGVLAIIFGVLGLNKTKQPGVPGKSRAIAGIVLGGVGVVIMPFFFLLISILLPSLNRAREVANRVKCASNERQIGQAIMMYQNANHGSYPPSLGDLLVTESLNPDVFVCPSGPTNPPGNIASMTPAQQSAWANASSDYIYVGPDQANPIPTTVIVYEKDPDHRDGLNILYGDGHVEFQPMVIAHQQIGH